MNIIGVSERIKKMCALSGVSVKQMLKNCDLSEKVIDNMSRGSYPSIDKIALIAKYFRLNIDQLIYEQPNDDDIFWRLSNCPAQGKLEKPMSIQETLDDFLIKKGYYVDISEEFRYKYLNLSEDGRKTINELLDFTYNKEKSNSNNTQKFVARDDNNSAISELNIDDLDNLPTMDEE